MIKEIFNNKKSEKRMLLLCVLAILIVVLCNINKLNVIYIIGDEFGYWANAATFVGMDWRDVISCNPYYSYGWSVFLVPILLLTHNPSIMYKMAIMLNAIFLCGSFLLAFACGTKLFKGLNRQVLCFSCLVITLYSSNIYQAQNTQSEILLFFWFWLLIWLLIKCLESNKYRYYILFSLACVYMYIIHMRNLGVCIAAGIVMLCIFFTRKDTHKRMIPTIICVVIGFIIATFVKDFLMDNAYLNEQVASINDYSGQVSKIEVLMTFRGIKLLLVNVIGRLFYLGTSSFFVIYWGLYALVKKTIYMINEIRLHKKINSINILSLFILLAFLGSLGISSISMIEVARMDTLIYGRYMDILVGPILLFGFAELFESRIQYARQMSFMVGHVTSAAIVKNTLEHFGVKQLFPGNVPGVVGLIHNGLTSAYIYFPYVAALKVIVISIFIVFILNLKKVSYKNRQMLALFGILVVWLYLGFFMTWKHTYDYQKNTKDYLIATIVNETNEEEGIYYVKEYGKDTPSLYVDYIQFLLPDSSIKITEYNEIKNIPDNAYILIDKDTAGIYIKENYYKITEGNYYDLYVKKDTDLADEVEKNLSSVEYSINFNNMHSMIVPEVMDKDIVSDGKEGYLLYGPYMKLDAGKYVVNFAVEILDIGNKADLGIVDVMGNGEQLAQTDLKIENITDNILQLPFECQETMTNIEFRVYVRENVKLKIKSITYMQTEFSEE